MSLRFTFEAWCRDEQLCAKPAAYLALSMPRDLNEGEARIVRKVPPSERGTKHRNPQFYAVEAMVNDTLTYPLGHEWQTADQLKASMIKAAMKGTTNA